MRDIVSPLMGLRSPFGGRVDRYKAAGFRPTLVADMTRDYYRSVSRQTFDDLFTHSRLGNATMVDSDGLLKWGPHNLALNSAAPATQSITVVSGADYTVECTGSGSITLSGAGTGTVTEGNPVEVTASTTSLTLTVAGDVDLMWCYRSDLGGMAPVPPDARVAGSTTYVPTTSTAKYLPRRHNHVYNGTAWVDAGTLIETEARTNLLHTTDALVTQSVTTTAAAHTLHFTGTGTVTLSGTSTAGPLVGTGTGEENRVSLTFTPTAGTLTLTVSGMVTDAQLEVGSTPSSYIPNLAASGTVTRAADTSGLTIPAYSTTRTTGSELVTNGTFDTDSDWTKGTGWSISGGVATFDTSATAGVDSVLEQTISVSDGVPHYVTVTFSDLTNLSGSELLVRVDGANLVANETGSANITADGTYTFSFTPSSNSSSLAIRLSVLTEGDETGTIDNISVKEAARIAPWPTPRVIGDELVVNGTFDADSDWTKGTGWTISGGVATHAAGTGSDLEQVGTVTAGKIYLLTLDVAAVRAASTLYVMTGPSNLYQTIETTVTVGSKTAAFVAPANGKLAIRLGSGADADIDNISVKEIDPLVVAIQMKGRATGDSYTSLRWYADANNYITQEIGTSDFTFEQAASGTVDSVTGGSITSGVNVPFNVASYHGSIFVGGAVGGAALTANETPVALADMSSNDISVGYDFMGNVEEVRIWVGGVTSVTTGDALAEGATA